MKIGITGADGFMGNHLVRRLKQEKIPHQVLDRAKHDLLDPKTLRDFVETCDAIIHLAAKNKDTNENIIRTNTLGTASLLNAINNYSPNRKIILLSSFQVYSPKSLYGLSKKLAEELIEYYTKHYSFNGIILRVSNVYGPGCKPFYNSAISTFIHLIKKNKPLKVNGDGSQGRDYLFVDDVIDAILKSIKTIQKNKIEYFDICSGRLTSLKDVINTLEKIAGRKVNVDFNTSTFGGVEIKERNYRKAEKLLNWKPKFSLEEGLRKSFT